MTRGDVWDVDLPGGRRPGVIVTRETAIDVLANVTVVEVTSTIRPLRTNVTLGVDHGLEGECVANADNLFTVPKSRLGRFRGTLGPAKIRQLDDALRVALGLD